jgi:two-component system response regulator (stage 0 sporulation protein A)
MMLLASRVQRILISNDSAEFGNDCQAGLQQQGYEVLRCEQDGRILLSAIRRERPELVVMEMQMRYIDAIGVIQALQKSGLSPWLIVIVSVLNPFVRQALQAIPKCHCFLWPVEAEMLTGRIDAILQAERRPLPRNSVQKQLEPIITQTLHAIGTPAHLKGHHYLRDAIQLAVRDREVLQGVTRGLYPIVGAHFGATGHQVERAIRNTIEITWERGDLETLSRYFGSTVHWERGKPTNLEFIALISDQIRMQYSDLLLEERPRAMAK